MKKYFFILFWVAAFIFFLSTPVFALADALTSNDIDSDLNSDIFRQRMNDLVQIQFYVKRFISSFLFPIFVIPGVIGLYLCPSLWVYLLSKKYIPTIHPALSWIPIIRLYPFTKSAWISGWWSLSFIGLIVWFLPVYIYVYFKLAKKLWRWIGTIIGLFFLPHFMIAYLGLKDAWKSTWPAWVFGLSGFAIIIIFIAWIVTNLLFNDLCIDTCL